MKKILFISFSVLSLGAYAQEETTKVEIVNQFEEVELLEKNEIRLNALDLILHPAISLIYERIVDESNGYGVSIFANLGDHDATYQNFSLTPYYRFYFLNRKDYGANGLFVEAFSSFSSVNFNDGWYGSEDNDKDEFQFSMGVSLGEKWVNQNGFSFEVFVGVGRYFINRETENYYNPEAHGRFGVSIGKRF